MSDGKAQYIITIEKLWVKSEGLANGQIFQSIISDEEFRGDAKTLQDKIHEAINNYPPPQYEGMRLATKDEAMNILIAQQAAAAYTEEAASFDNDDLAEALMMSASKGKPN